MFRKPLSDVFGGTPSSSANRLAQHLAAQSPQVQNSPPKATLASSPRRLVDSPKPNQVQQATTKPHPAPQDSGYFGSQDVNPVNADSIDENEPTMPFDEEMADGLPTDAISSPAHNSYMNKTTHFAEQEQPARELTQGPGHGVTPLPTRNNGNSPQQAPLSHVSSPTKARTEEDIIEEDENEAASQHSAQPSSGDARSNSDGSSPVRHPVIRKSSLNFASLPAREPLTAGKSVGARVSRTSHLDANRTSYYSRHTGGKSLGHIARHDESEEEEEEDQDQDEMDVDDFPPVPSPPKPSNEEDVAVHHNKTYTQRLQDQINLLGKSQPNGGRSSKSIQGLANAQQPAAVAQPAPEPKSPSPRKQEMTTTPGAFPEDEDDDWIDPPAPELVAQQSSTPRPTLSKSYSTDVMEGIHSKQTLGAPEMEEYETANKAVWTSASPQRPNVLGHGKSASVPAVPLTVAASMQHGSPLSKTVSASIPAGVLSSISQTSPVRTPGKSPSRHFRESPLKHVKNQLSSFFGRGRDLLASSAALSAEGKASIISPSSARLELHTGPSSDTIATKASFASKKTDVGSFAPGREKSPSRPVAKRTRASVEREKEEKRREKEAKIMADQMDKLEDAREKEREKARVFSKEQERIVSMEKQISSKKENENPTLKETPKQTRTSPRKAATQQETSSKPTEQDTEMADAPSAVPAFVPRSAGPNQGPRPKELRRPLKPAKEPLAKPKPVPTVIRVNTGSQHSQFLPSGSNASAGFQEPPASTGSQLQQPLTSKASKASLQPKPSSSQSFKSSTSSNGRPKALELAARKKEQDEREAQRRRDLKADMERKRAVAQEEQKKQEQQRRLEAERQKQSQREQAEAKKTAQRQAAIEKAKQTRAPPPAVRGQPTGPPDYKSTQDKVGSVQRGDGPPSRPPSRMNSGIYRPQEDGGRQFNGMHSNAPKAVPKRPLGQDGNEERQARHAPSRGGPQYQTQDAKRRRTSDDFADELEMDNPPNIKGPPVRPSGGFKQVSFEDIKMHTSRVLTNTRTSKQSRCSRTVTATYLPAPPVTYSRRLLLLSM